MANIDHAMSESNGTSLDRQVTVTLSPEQYERMFFQPEGPRRGDLAKRFANPTLFGLICFIIPYSSTMFCLLGWAGATTTSLSGLNGDYYFIGVIGMLVAGLCEFVLGNTFPMAVFLIFGTHWGATAYQQDPSHQTAAAFTYAGGTTGVVYNSSQAFHNVTMAIVSFMLMLGSFRVNVPFVLTFFGLIFLFSFVAAADFYVPYASTAADFNHVTILLRTAGGFGLIGFFCGWYLVLLTVCEAVGLPSFLPVFDLSTRVFPPSGIARVDIEKQA